MPTFEIYCPCKVAELGSVILQGDFDPYIFGGWIIDTTDKRGLCKHCGERVLIRGQNPIVDEKFKRFLRTDKQ